MKVILFANTEWYLFNFRLALIQELSRKGVDVLLISPPGKYGERLRAAGFRWQALPMERRSLNPLSELKLVAALARLYYNEQPDAVHHFTIKCIIYGAFAAWLTRVPARINAVAGLGYVFTNPSITARLLRPPVRRLLRWALNNTHSRLILQNSDDMADLQQARIADSEHVRLIKGSGVDTARFQPSTEPILSGDQTRVLLASRLLGDKGIKEYVDAARALRAEGVPIRFFLAGKPDPGNPDSIQQAQLDAWAAEGDVELLGHVDDMQKQLASTDIVVLPSHREGLPKCLIEAAACGLPLVTTDVPGCREVVTDGVDGLLVPVKKIPRNLRRRFGACMKIRRLPEGLDRLHGQRP